MSHFSKNRYSTTELLLLECPSLPASLLLLSGKHADVTPSVCHGVQGLIPHAVSARSICAHPLQGASVTLVT